MHNQIILSVVVATFNGSEYIERCLDSFTTQSINNELFEVLIVDNNSTDNTVEIVSHFCNSHSHLRLIQESCQGVSFARNRGISESKGKYICFIDDDAYADKDWLSNILNAFETVIPHPAVIGGKIYPYYLVTKPAWFSDSFEIRTKGDHAKFLPEQKCVFGFPESNYSVRKDILDELGGFSTDYGPKAKKMIFGEGAELSTRIAGKYPHFWYDPSIYVYHSVPPRNMKVSYILSRKYRSARNYQVFESNSAGFLKISFTFLTCLIRIFYNFLLSLFLVRWFTKRAKTDWLTHMIPLVNCTSRVVYIVGRVFGIRR